MPRFVILPLILAVVGVLYPLLITPIIVASMLSGSLQFPLVTAIVLCVSMIMGTSGMILFAIGFGVGVLAAFYDLWHNGLRAKGGQEFAWHLGHNLGWGMVYIFAINLVNASILYRFFQLKQAYLLSPGVATVGVLFLRFLPVFVLLILLGVTVSSLNSEKSFSPGAIFQRLRLLRHLG